jgi:hypothetical protein
MCCVSDAIYGRKDGKEVGNFGSKHENARQKMEIVKALKLRRIVNRLRLVELNQGQ